jgi:uncharacterized protein
MQQSNINVTMGIAMQINEDNNLSRYQIRGYSPGEVTINEKKHHSSLILTSDQLITHWGPLSLAEITAADLEKIDALKPEIVLLGTGLHFILPPPHLRHFDSMNTAAACRTFSALSAEGRNVAAALIIQPNEGSS